MMSTCVSPKMSEFQYFYETRNEDVEDYLDFAKRWCKLAGVHGDKRKALFIYQGLEGQATRWYNRLGDTDQLEIVFKTNVVPISTQME